MGGKVSGERPGQWCWAGRGAGMTCQPPSHHEVMRRRPGPLARSGRRPTLPRCNRLGGQQDNVVDGIEDNVGLALGDKARCFDVAVVL
jgi:hypothetical protein